MQDIVKSLTDLKKYEQSLESRDFSIKDNKIYMGKYLVIETPSKKVCDNLFEQIITIFSTELSRVKSVVTKVENQFKVLEKDLIDEIGSDNSIESGIEIPVSSTIEECEQVDKEHAKELAEECTYEAMQEMVDGYIKAVEISREELISEIEKDLKENKPLISKTEKVKIPKKELKGFGNCDDCEWTSLNCNVERDSEKCLKNKIEKIPGTEQQTLNLNTDNVTSESEVDAIEKAMDEAIGGLED